MKTSELERTCPERTERQRGRVTERQRGRETEKQINKQTNKRKPGNKVVYEISAKTNDSNSRKWPKTLKNRKKMRFLRFGEPQYFFPARLPLLVCRDHPKLPSYAISAKTNDSNSRKWPKTLKNRKKMRFLRFAEPQHFFLEIGLRHFSPFTSEQLCAKNLRNPMMGSMIILRYRRTD